MTDRLTRLERFYDGPIPAPLRRWALERPDAPEKPYVSPYLNKPLRSLAEVERKAAAE